MKHRALLYYFFVFLLLASQACSPAGKVVSDGRMPSLKATTLPDSMLNKFRNGTDFFAQGNIPSPWSLEMNFNRGYSFNSADGIRLSMPAFKPAIITDSLIRYQVTRSEGAMAVSIYKTPCSANGTRTEVVVNNTLYKGCGSYLYDPKLNGRWLLQSANGKIFSGKDFRKGLPELIFSISENKISGTDGCGEISAKIEIAGSGIRFSTVTFNGSDCAENEVRKIFRDKLSNSTATYYFKDGLLYLYLIDDSIIIYKRG